MQRPWVSAVNPHTTTHSSARSPRFWTTGRRGWAAFEDDVGALILDALETEIARWESLSRQDEEARSVLRAFLGLREFLWEMGIRSKTPPPAVHPSSTGKTTSPSYPSAEGHSRIFKGTLMIARASFPANASTLVRPLSFFRRDPWRP